MERTCEKTLLCRMTEMALNLLVISIVVCLKQ